MTKLQDLEKRVTKLEEELKAIKKTSGFEREVQNAV